MIALERDPHRWLPLALASLYVLVGAYGMKSPQKISDVLRAWGLAYDADRLCESSRADDAIAGIFGG